MTAAATAPLPLLAARDLAAPLAWCAGVPVSAGRFIAEAQALALQLPEGRPVNLCQDRYRFALGLAAALLRGQTSLMPPNALPDTLRQVPAEGGAPYLLIDDEPPATGGLATFRIERPEVEADASEVPLIATDLVAVCLLTSGSTGAPQPHAKRWGPLVANIGSEAERLAEHLGRPTLAGLTLVGTVPAQHSYGFESTVLLAMLGGACFEGGRPFYPADIADALAAVPEPRALVTTPFHLKTLLAADLVLPGVALALSATAPLSPQLAAQAETAFGGQLIEIYGCTEAGQVASRRTTAGLTWRTLGALRITREGQADAADERFVVAGGHVTEATPLADVLELDSATQFRLLGRANDLVHVAGKRSSLAHLNFHLNRIEGVLDGAFWLPQETPDQTPDGIVRTVAFVVAPGLAAREVIAALRREIEPAFVPRRVVHVDALPREATGKLTVSALNAFARATLAALDRGERVITVPPEHPAFAGHFPGHPVLPGVALLSMVMEALGDRAGPAPRIDNAKFLQPVLPGATLTLALTEQARGFAFELRQGDRTVARGAVTPSA
jgi:acyl-coenzyme A synthetase/AMP-(fatty) acid ligase